MKTMPLLAAVLLATVTVSAQSPAPMPATAPAPMPATAATPVPVVPVGSRVGNFQTAYEDGGRRDPFKSLVMPKRASTTGPAATGGRPRSGLAGVVLADVTVRGIVRNGQTMFAILETPGKQSFVARPKDRLADASIQSIDREGVVFADASGGGAPIEVRKALRTSGDEVR